MTLQITETEFNEYIKLKGKKERQNEYLCNYLNERRKYMKEHEPEKYKIYLEKQSVANKKYSKKQVQKLKENPEEYKEFRAKQNEYLKQYKKEQLLKLKENPEAYEAYKINHNEYRNQKKKEQLLKIKENPELYVQHKLKQQEYLKKCLIKKQQKEE